LGEKGKDRVALYKSLMTARVWKRCFAAPIKNLKEIDQSRSKMLADKNHNFFSTYILLVTQSSETKYPLYCKHGF